MLRKGSLLYLYFICMRIKLRQLFWCSLCVFLSSCIYDTDETYNTPLKAAQEPTLEIINLSLNEETFYLRGYINITFKFKTASHKIAAVELLVDDVQQSVIYDFLGKFTINSSNYRIGSHNLTLKIYAKTGTGSLADQLDLENYVFTRSYVMIIY